MTKPKKNLTVIKQHAAGIDIGSKKIFIAVPNMPVKSFDTFTSSFQSAIEYLKENKIKSVAMESTGDYSLRYARRCRLRGLSCKKQCC